MRQFEHTSLALAHNAYFYTPKMDASCFASGVLIVQMSAGLSHYVAFQVSFDGGTTWTNLAAEYGNGATTRTLYVKNLGGARYVRAYVRNTSGAPRDFKLGIKYIGVPSTEISANVP